MNPADAAELLSLAAAFDRRKIGHADAVAWADALTGLEPRDCAEAIRAHFRESTDYLMPAHVRQGVARIRADRLRVAGNLEPEYDPNDVAGGIEAIRRQRQAIADGRTPVENSDGLTRRPVAELVAATAARLPKMPSL